MSIGLKCPKCGEDERIVIEKSQHGDAKCQKCLSIYPYDMFIVKEKTKAKDLAVDDIRREVFWFAQQMEWKLRQMDKTKGPIGWKKVPPSVFAINIRQKTDAMYDEVSKTIDYDVDRVIDVCADLGNYAMMIADTSYEESVGPQKENKEL